LTFCIWIVFKTKTRLVGAIQFLQRDEDLETLVLR